MQPLMSHNNGFLKKACYEIAGFYGIACMYSIIAIKVYTLAKQNYDFIDGIT